MPSLRLKFPEKEQHSVIALSGPRITVGRAPYNSIQILDRTVSAKHAEFVAEEDGHYRLHDFDSANGTFASGERVTDFHLRENVKLAFGTVEVEFTLETRAEAEGLPGRGEVDAMRQDNAKLKEQIATLRAELDAAHAKTLSPEEAGQGVPRTEYEKAIEDREQAKAAQHRSEEDAARLQADIAVLRNDRDNLQRALDAANAELETLRSAPAPAQVPVAAPVVAAQPVTPKQGMPFPTIKAVPAAVPKTPATLPLGANVPAPRTVPLATPKAPVAVPRPPSVPGASANTAAAATVKLKPTVHAVPPAGPKGTQKLNP